MNKNNNNLRKNSFKEEELKQYVKNGDLKESDIKIILDYQKLLPVLQQEDGSWIDARMLHKELKVGKDFTTWIKGKISKYEFIENEDYKFCSPNGGAKVEVVIISLTTLSLLIWQRNCLWWRIIKLGAFPVNILSLLIKHLKQDACGILIDGKL